MSNSSNAQWTMRNNAQSTMRNEPIAHGPLLSEQPRFPVKDLSLRVAPGFSCPHVFVCQAAWWRGHPLDETWSQENGGKKINGSSPLDPKKDHK